MRGISRPRAARLAHCCLARKKLQRRRAEFGLEIHDKRGGVVSYLGQAIGPGGCPLSGCVDSQVIVQVSALGGRELSTRLGEEADNEVPGIRDLLAVGSRWSTMRLTTTRLSHAFEWRICMLDAINPALHIFGRCAVSCSSSSEGPWPSFRPLSGSLNACWCV